jgi:hypothetical protein
MQAFDEPLGGAWLTVEGDELTLIKAAAAG